MVRFVFSLVSSFLALVFFGLAMTGGLSDSRRSQLELMHENHLSQIILVGKSALHIKGWPDSHADELTDEQVRTLEDYQTGISLIRVNMTNSVIVIDNEGKQEEYTYFDYAKNYPLNQTEITYDKDFLAPFQGFLEVDPESNLLNWEKDSRLSDTTTCHLPENDSEMAITGYKADMYLQYGYRNESGTVEQLSSIDDLIGRKLDRFTICGIYNPNEPKDIISSHLDDNKVRFDGLSLRDAYLSGTSLNSFAIVYKHSFYNFRHAIEPDNLSNREPTNVLINLPDSVDEGMRLLSSLHLERITDNDAMLPITYDVKLMCPYTGLVNSANEYRSGWVKILLFVLAGVFGFLSSIILMFSLMLGFEGEKHSLALLYAFGVSKGGLFRIFLGASLYWLVLCLVPSFIVILILCNVLNSSFGFPFLIFGFAEIGYFLLFAMAVTLLGSLVPFSRFLFHKPYVLLKDTK